MTTAAAALPSGRPIPATERLLSLDAFRGFTMLWLAGGAALIRAFKSLFDGPAFAAFADQFEHSRWEGLTFWDTVMPSFLFMVGMSVPFATGRRSQAEPRSRVLRHAFRRAAVIFLLGSLRESISHSSPYLIELSSTLQPIAVSYLVCVLIERTRAWVHWLAALLFLALPALVLGLVSVPGLPPETYSREANLCFRLDLQFLGRTHKDVWGTVLPELLIPATAIFGMIAGKALLREGSRAGKLRRLIWMGAAAVAAGLALSPVVPVIMRIWTASYGILSAGVACLMFAASFWIIDIRGWRRWTFPLVVIGTNALAAYMLPSIVPISRHVGIFTRDIASAIGPAGPVFRAAAVLAVQWSILYWLYRRKIFLRP